VSTSKLIVLTRIESSRKDLSLFGYDEIESEKYEIWDISRATSQPSHEWEFKEEAEESERIKRLNNFQEIEKKLVSRREKNNFYVLNRTWKDTNLIKKLRKAICQNGKLVEKIGKAYPSSNKYGYCKGFLNAKKTYLKRLVGNLTKRASQGKSEYVFIPTSWYKNRSTRQGIKTKIRKIHSIEYDECLNTKLSESKKNEKGAVFLDQAIPYHEGLKRKYGENWIQEKKYYEKVNKFLIRCEKSIGLKKKSICIAAHPNSDKEKIESNFEERRVYKGETAKLVKKNNTAITHYSSSALYAIIFEKKLCLFSIKYFMEDEKEKVNHMSRIYGRNVNYASEKGYVDYGKNKKSYDKVMKRFIKAPSTPSINSWVYVYNTLVG
jgi:hypothetical protein